MYLNPKDVKNKEELVSIIREVFGNELANSDLVRTALDDKNGDFKIIRKKIDPGDAEKIKSKLISGLSIGYEDDRYYPDGDLVAHVLGFLGYNNNVRVGQYGVEGYYNDELAGKSNQESSDFSSGDSLVLTIDKNIQSFAKKTIEDTVKNWNAVSGQVIVEDPRTGAILAMASTPSFDPNSYSTYPLANFVNSNTQDIFEPGSTMKGITMASAIDASSVSPETTYYDKGEESIAGYTIKNYDEKSHGTQTMTQVLEKSLNTGAIFAQRALGNSAFLRYIEAFGFGRKTGVGLFGEISGDISNLYSKRDVNFATASFGQGISVTTLQLINAYAAIANGGNLLQPFIVSKIIKANGSEVNLNGSKILGHPISKQTSQTISKMLVSVVEKGFDKATISSYSIAGKTGTAQIPDPQGGYSEDYIHDFLGYAPAYDPRFVILLRIDRPHEVRFASTSLVPSFRELTQFLLNYLEIQPDQQPDNI